MLRSSSHEYSHEKFYFSWRKQLYRVILCRQKIEKQILTPSGEVAGPSYFKANLFSHGRDVKIQEAEQIPITTPSPCIILKVRYVLPIVFPKKACSLMLKYSGFTTKTKKTHLIRHSPYVVMGIVNVSRTHWILLCSPHAPSVVLKSYSCKKGPCLQ